MNFIKKIVDGRVDESVHFQFQKFGKGEYKDRALVKAKNSGGKFTILTTSEFVNGLVREIAEKLNEEKANITGAIISTSDLKGKLEFKDIKQFQGVKKYIIDSEMSGNEILKIIDEIPKAFFALSFNVDKDSTMLKIKPKAPKSGKPSSKKDETPKPDFCKLITKDRKIAESFVFENPDFKEAEIRHDFIINEMIISEEMKKEKDFAKMRETAKRKGKIIRKALIDGREMEKEIEFVV